MKAIHGKQDTIRHHLTRRFRLTERQVAVAELLYRRRTNVEIANCLGISVHTAKRHVEMVLLKLGIPSRTMVEDVLEQQLGPNT